MLAVIQHDKHTPVTDIPDDHSQRIRALYRYAQHIGDHGRHNLGAFQQAKIDEGDLAIELPGKAMPDLYRYRGLADPGGSNNVEEWGGNEPLREESDVGLASDEPWQAGRKPYHLQDVVTGVVGRRGLRGRRQGGRRAVSLELRHEGVSHANLRRNVSGSPYTVAQMPAQVRHVEAKASVLDDDVRPNTFQQGPLRQNLARVLDHHNQKIEGASAHIDWRAVLREASFARHEAKRSERDPRFKVLVPCFRH
jgi:hypothetical protein